jgi:hypothetical protein
VGINFVNVSLIKENKVTIFHFLKLFFKANATMIKATSIEFNHNCMLLKKTQFYAMSMNEMPMDII